MRVGEAMGLACDDFDASRGLLAIRNAKFGSVNGIIPVRQSVGLSKRAGANYCCVSIPRAKTTKSGAAD
jgi:integrase